MIKVHFVQSGSGGVRTIHASVLAVTDLVGGHSLKAQGGEPLSADASSAPASRVLIELPAGVDVPGAPAPGIYLVEGLDAHEAEHEILAAPGESGG